MSVLERADVEGRQAAVPEQPGCRPRGPDELGDVDVGQRRDPVGDVTQQVGRVPGETEADDRAEQRVLHRAHHARRPVRRHRLHLERRPVRRALERLGERRGPRCTSAAQLDLVRDVEPDPAEVGPVPQRRDRRLQRDRPADPLGRRDRLVGVVHEVRRQDLDADRREQGRRPVPGPASAAPPSCVSQPATSRRAVRVSAPLGCSGSPRSTDRHCAYRAARPSARTPSSGRAVGGHGPRPAGLVEGRQLGRHTVQLVHAGDRGATRAGCRGGELRLEHRIGSTDGRDAHRDDDVAVRVVVQRRDRVADLVGVGVLGQQDDAPGRDEAGGGRGLRDERGRRRPSWPGSRSAGPPGAAGAPGPAPRRGAGACCRRGRHRPGASSRPACAAARASRGPRARAAPPGPTVRPSRRPPA